MSIVAETDLATLLPDLSIVERTALLDGAEAHVSRLIGRTLSTAFDPDDPPADPGLVPNVARAEPLGQTTEEIELEVPETGWLIPMPIGPITEYDVISIAGSVQALGDFILRPWAIKRPRSRTIFRRFDTLVAEVKVGWTVATLPAEIRQCVLAVALAHSGSSWAGGATTESGKIVRETIGPYTAGFANPGSGGAGGASGTSTVEIDALAASLLMQWARPTEGIGL